MPHQWNIADPIQESCLQGVHPSVLVRQVLWNRGMRTAEEARRFLKPDYHRDLHDPFLFRDMEKAVARILKAIEGKERIVIHGDYDADGVSGTIVLVSTLAACGLRPEIYLPHREKDGYSKWLAGMDSDRQLIPNVQYRKGQIYLAAVSSCRVRAVNRHPGWADMRFIPLWLHLV